MKNTNKLLIRVIDICSIIVFFSCVQIPSIMRIIHGESYLQTIRILIIIACSLYCLIHKRLAPNMGLITLWSIITVLSTYLSGYDWSYSIQIITIPFLMCFFLSINIKNIDRILRIWSNLLTILVLLDFTTIILFPKGMYYDGLFDINWFLGYKTARFAYQLPLCSISAYLDEKKFGRIGIKTYLMVLISIYCSYKSQALAATVCMILFGFSICLFDSSKNVKYWKVMFYKIFNYKTVIPAYIISVIAVIGIKHFGLVQYIVVNWFKKDITLTTRTFIWDSVIEMLMKRPIIGYGILNQKNYIEITLNPFATSAHNLSLAILMAGGVLGAIIYVLIIGRALYRKNKQYYSYDIPIVLAVLIFLIIGITSESLLFSEFSLVLLYLLLIKEGRKRNEYRC